MASITIVGLDEAEQAKLRVRAAEHGRSVEEEACEILKEGLEVKQAPPESLWQSIRRKIEPLGGVELEIPPREFDRDPPDFSE